MEKKFDMYVSGAEFEDLKRQLGLNQLLSQWNDRQSIEIWGQYLKEHKECTSKLFIDSGAYTAGNKDIKIDIDDYINYINSIDDYVTIFAELDITPAEVFQEDTSLNAFKVSAEKSWNNYLYMIDRVKSVDKLIPVFHAGEDLNYLKKMVEFRHKDGHLIEYIGLGPGVSESLTLKVDWFKKCFKVIKESCNPNVKVHAFGMTSFDVLEEFPFTSADSTSWILGAAFGRILVEGRVAITLSNRKQLDSSHLKNKTKEIQDIVRKKFENLGYNIDDFDNLSPGELRAAMAKFSLVEIATWCNNYKCNWDNSSQISKNQLW